MDTLTIAFDDRNLAPVISDRRYRISPAIKAMETGISIPDSISDNYRKEIAGSLKYQWLGRFDFILNVNWLKLNENIKKKNISRYQRVGKEIGDKDK